MLRQGEPSAVRLAADHAGDLTRTVRDVPPSGQVEQDQGVPERVRYDRDPADRDVERAGQHLTARSLDGLGRFVSGINQPVRLIPLLRCQVDLGVAAGQAEPSLPDLLGAPAQFVTERIAVETQASVEVRNRDGDCVDLLESGAVRMAPSEPGSYCCQALITC
jgi:hypothetical protein